ncbi:MAG: sulfate adenylyltransferase subunit CysD [Caldilineaceae bacterium SB0668_bin_21]|nr:sulfate adenylyltransferase subunit CysD [Caldilineaceae bacterium SB0668_bin_21]MYC23782.1 sulfate adenylyltransferase subunit CysD [Caldilineaceae bacterium SB0662_bin_25]
MDETTLPAGVEAAEAAETTGLRDRIGDGSREADFSPAGEGASTQVRHAAPLTGHLRQLEAEAIYVLREVAAQFERPCLLFSGGKDSIVCAHLARKAFTPGRIPFPLLHIDTGHNFPETLAFRDELVKKLGVRLLVRSVQDSIDAGRVQEEPDGDPSRNRLQTVTLLDAVAELRIDAAVGGARRDEEKARAKERFFSHRDGFGQWDPKNQRPELWNLFNGRKLNNEHFRVFPISNWTELDIWQYIAEQAIDLPSLYFAHERDVVNRDGILLAVGAYVEPRAGEAVSRERVRFRTIGDMTCTGAFRSSASSLAEIIDEVATARITERGDRADDRRSEAAMEDRKRLGYF